MKSILHYTFVSALLVFMSIAVQAQNTKTEVADTSKKVILPSNPGSVKGVEGIKTEKETEEVEELQNEKKVEELELKEELNLESPSPLPDPVGSEPVPGAEILTEPGQSELGSPPPTKNENNKNGKKQEENILPEVK
jgi:hypothetical protein